jgi:predicted transcriptional regulator of viral defense system
MSNKITWKVLQALANAPDGIMTLDILESLHLCSDATLKTTLSRLSKKNEIIRLKRSVYSTNPVHNIFSAAQYVFGGYIAFSSALYLHGLITELPYTVRVVTSSQSAVKTLGQYELQAIALGDKAVGFERLGNLVVSTRAKTLFDCVCIPTYSVEEDKLVDAYRNAKMKTCEWSEFDRYVSRFARGKKIKKLNDIKKRIRGK